MIVHSYHVSLLVASSWIEKMNGSVFEGRYQNHSGDESPEVRRPRDNALPEPRGQGA